MRKGFALFVLTVDFFYFSSLLSPFYGTSTSGPKSRNCPVFDSFADIFHLKLAAANQDEVVLYEWASMHAYAQQTHTRAYTMRQTCGCSCTDTHKHKHKIKEGEAEPRGCLELFPNQRHWGKQERPSVSAEGTLSGLQSNTHTRDNARRISETHTHKRRHIPLPLQIDSTSEEHV